MVADTVEKDVVTLTVLDEVLPGVIDDEVRAQRPDHIHISRTADAGHLCAEGLRDLNGERTTASSGAVNQDSLAPLNVATVAKSLQCCEPRDGRACRLLKRHVVGLCDQR